MKKFNARDFFEAVAWAHRIEGITSGLKDTEEDLRRVITAKDKRVLLEGIKKLREKLAEIGAVITVMQIDRIEKNLKPKGTTYKQIKTQIGSMNSRLIDELSLIELYLMDNKKSEYYNSALNLFGQEVCDRFPSAIPDIEDAGRTLACMQSTAAVFHLMRIMETGLKANLRENIRPA